MTLELLDQKTKTFTIKEIWEALDKNGLQHLRGTWFSSSSDKVIGGCALGQTAYNLGVPANEDYNNDSNLALLLNKFSVDSESKWYQSGCNVADTIVYWNDLVVTDTEGHLVLEDGEYIYALPTYAEVSQMAYDVLQPHFNETIELPHYDY